MKHDWKYVRQGPEGISNHGKRQCANCGKIQTKEVQQSWGRVTGYQWFPLVGRCKGKT